MPTDKPRFTITVDPALMQEIEDYRYNHRIKNQTQAVISLMPVSYTHLSASSSSPSLSRTGSAGGVRLRLVEYRRAPLPLWLSLIHIYFTAWCGSRNKKYRSAAALTNMVVWV